jgi:hypothetical protein
LGIVIGDLNGDARLDMAETNSLNANVIVLLNTSALLAVPPQSSPSRLRLSMSPNPTAGEIAIAFVLPQAATVTLRVCDVAGRSVRTLMAARLPAGDHVARWDGRTSAGNAAPDGIYFLDLSAGEYRSMGRMVVLR